MKRVIVRVSRDGSKTTVEVDGVAGTSCKELTAGLLSRLGVTSKEELTDDYYKSETEMVTEGY